MSRDAEALATVAPVSHRIDPSGARAVDLLPLVDRRGSCGAVGAFQSRCPAIPEFRIWYPGRRVLLTAVRCRRHAQAYAMLWGLRIPPEPECNGALMVREG